MKNEAGQQVEEALDFLAASLERGESETLKAYLAAMGHFRQYSIGSQMLIARARPEATQVAGFHTWRKMGRMVRKGETGIRILAPIVARGQRRADGGQAMEADERAVVGFRTAVVFDVAQTEGRELPRLGEVRGEVGELWPRLLAWARAMGIEVTLAASLGGACGLSGGGRVLIREDLSPAEQFSTLVHELAHERLHRGEGRPASHAVRETEAEAAAFVVCHTCGLETGRAAEDYIRLHAGDRQTLLSSLGRIRGVAAEMLSALERSSAEVQACGAVPPATVELPAAA